MLQQLLQQVRAAPWPPDRTALRSGRMRKLGAHSSTGLQQVTALTATASHTHVTVTCSGQACLAHVQANRITLITS